jgi:outer membrane biosynthesis protein TonB
MINSPSASRSQENWRRWDRTFSRSLVASVLLHALLVWLFREAHPVPEINFAAAGEQADDDRAAAGGGMELITLVEARPPAEPEPEPVPVEPVPVPQEVPREVPPPPPEEPVRAPPQSTGQTAAAGEGRGRDAGPGTETGTGAGDGGTSESGTGVSAPVPRGMILPPSDRPRSLSGKTVTVYLFVDVRGSVVRDSTRLNPSTGDSRFDNRLKQQAGEWRFRPATQAGQPVPSWFPYSITF